jgi:hypothetical protein
MEPNQLKARLIDLFGRAQSDQRELLPEALRRQPDVVEWSKVDPDLISLHGLPAYQALYES